MFFNALALAVWMLLRGVDPDKFAAARHERHGAPPAGDATAA
jgi:hypothetical protein